MKLGVTHPNSQQIRFLPRQPTDNMLLLDLNVLVGDVNKYINAYVFVQI